MNRHAQFVKVDRYRLPVVRRYFKSLVCESIRYRDTDPVGCDLAWYKAKGVLSAALFLGFIDGIIFQRVEQKLFNHRHPERAQKFSVVCGWCKKTLREGDPYRVSHGICPDCKGRMLAGLPGTEPVPVDTKRVISVTS